MNAIGWVPFSSVSRVHPDDLLVQVENGKYLEIIGQIYTDLIESPIFRSRVEHSALMAENVMKDIGISGIIFSVKDTPLKECWKDQKTTEFWVVLLYSRSLKPPQLSDIILYCPSVNSVRRIAWVQIPVLDITGFVTFSLNELDRELVDDDYAVLKYAYSLFAYDSLENAAMFLETFGFELLIIPANNELSVIPDVAQCLLSKIELLNTAFIEFKGRISPKRDVNVYNKLVEDYTDLNVRITKGRYVLDISRKFTEQSLQRSPYIVWDVINLGNAVSSVCQLEEEVLRAFEKEMKLQQIDRKCIDSELERYPNLKNLIGDDPNRYEKYRPYLYKTEFSSFKERIQNIHSQCESLRDRLLSGNEDVPTLLREEVSAIPWFRWYLVYSGSLAPDDPGMVAQISDHLLYDSPDLDKIHYESETFALGGIILNSVYSDERQMFKRILTDVENLLGAYPVLRSQSYKQKLCREFQEMHAEMKVYDQLVHLGYFPVHEPQISGTSAKPDFVINDENQDNYFIEVKYRHESFEEILQSYGLSEYLLQTDYIDPNDDTRKTLDVIASAILNQISKWNNAAIDTPVILIVEIGPFQAFPRNQLNLDCEHLVERLRERSHNSSVTIPHNLIGVILFSSLTSVPDGETTFVAAYPLQKDSRNALFEDMHHRFFSQFIDTP